MTHHITGDLFKRMSAEHSFPSVSENSRTAKSPVVMLGTRHSEFIMKILKPLGKHWGKKGCFHITPEHNCCSQTTSLYVFHWSEVPTSQKSYLILLCQPFLILSWFYSKQSNSGSFMLKATGKQTSSFIPLKKFQQNVSPKSSENRKPQAHQNFQGASAFLCRHFSLECPSISLPFHLFASCYTNLLCINKAQQYLHELCIYLSSLGL